MNQKLNIFYSEPDPDRWFKYDRYVRKVVRRLIRGRQRPGGVGMIALNLMQGLDRQGVAYRYNDFKYIDKHPEEIACIIGKPHLLFERKWSNPIIFGAGVYSHPVECPDLTTKYPNIKRILVPGGWMKTMFDPYYTGKVSVWPAGIDTDQWSPKQKAEVKFDFLIYDKIRWDHDSYQENFIMPICKTLDKYCLSYDFVKYGNYRNEDLLEKLKTVKGVIFLCEHETQGLAYQQILATGTPILAWDRGGYWQDPYYYPNKAKFEPVSSVPYWDERCGVKFTGLKDFSDYLDEFIVKLNQFNPRSYIVENLTLEKSTSMYLDIYDDVMRDLI